MYLLHTIVFLGFGTLEVQRGAAVKFILAVSGTSLAWAVLCMLPTALEPSTLSYH